LCYASIVLARYWLYSLKLKIDAIVSEIDAKKTAAEAAKNTLSKET